MKWIFKVIKKIIISSFLLYIYNYFAIAYHLVVPINVITIAIVSIFDVFGLIGLVIFKYFIL